MFSPTSLPWLLPQGFKKQGDTALYICLDLILGAHDFFSVLPALLTLLQKRCRNVDIGITWVCWVGKYLVSCISVFICCLNFFCPMSLPFLKIPLLVYQSALYALHSSAFEYFFFLYSYVSGLSSFRREGVVTSPRTWCSFAVCHQKALSPEFWDLFELGGRLFQSNLFLPVLPILGDSLIFSRFILFYPVRRE